MRRIFCFISLSLLLISGEVLASHEKVSTVLRGDAICANAQLEIRVPEQDSVFWKVESREVYVRLYLAEDRKIAHNSNQQYKVHYTIALYDINQNITIITDSVMVDYNTTGGYTDICVARYLNYKRASLQILSVSGSMPDDIFLELGVDVTKYPLSSTFSSTINTLGIHQPETNELLLTWGYVGGADEYDVEWLFVDNPSNELFLAYDFANATRITTSDNHYKIPLAYPRGNILFRVRARGTYVSGGRYYPVFGEWSFTPSSGHIPEMVSNAFFFGYGGLEDSLTWQYTAVYAEEGKRKEVITFYDGTLRNRQEVTINNTDKVAIVSETFYDHVGRQALQSIPAPTPSRGVRYYGTGNSSNGLFNGNFEKNNYDYDNTLTHALPFPANAGSAVYHSSNNPFLNNTHWVNVAQTPADSGYTYSHTRYLNDGTDRIHSQSAPGYTFRMGGGKETRYYYGNPMQMELDRLFGNEVGDASHYQKVVTVDANGENTVSYYDMKERLIASAIIPSSNTNLLPVDYTPETEPLIETHVFDGNSRSYTQSIVVATPTSYDFTYHVKTASALCDTCNESVGCIDCRYKVVFSLWNPDQLNYVFIDTLITQVDIALQHDTMLLPGSYQLYKSIAIVDDDETNVAYEAYSWRQRPCIHFQGADTARCYTVCEEYAMEVCSLTTPNLDDTCYMRVLYECENPPQDPNTECEAKRLAMLADMSPGGQYFDYKLTCCPADSCLSFCEPGFQNSFLNTICRHRLDADTVLENILGSLNTNYGDEGCWDTLRKHWQPEFAEVMLKYHPEYHLFMAQCECGENEQIQDFDKLFFNTNTFDKAKEMGLLNPLGLEVNENTNISHDPDQGFQPFKSDTTDPFFQKELSCCQDKYEEIYEHIRNRMLSYMSWRDNEEYHISIWYLLFDPDTIAQGGNPPGCEGIKVMMENFQKNIVRTWAQEHNCSENDARWLLFKSIYLYLKEEIRQTVLPACLLNCCIEMDGRDECDELNCCNDPSLQWGQYEWWSSQFDTSALAHCDYYLKADTGCSCIPLTPGTDPKCEGGFQIRFLCNPVYGLNVDNYMASRDSLLLLAYEDCCADCEAYANGWMEELHDYLLTYCHDCFVDSSKWFDIRQRLIDLCTKSCQKSYDDEDFSVHQRIDLMEFEHILSDYCDVYPENYTRIIYPRPTDYFSDCGCQNYQNALHTYGLTFWDDLSLIASKLQAEGIIASTQAISEWNHFCIWQLYENMLRNIDDTLALYEANFPEQFRCMPELSELELCQQQAILAAAAQDTITFYHILDSMVTVHRAIYEPHCMSGLADTLRISCHSQEFLYTLYYYDQADNLIKTIPPKGVHPIQNQATLDSVSYYRHNISRYDTLLSGFIHPRHTMATNYKYNTLNQITVSYQPDHDSVAVTYYDILSRPVLSQNGKQKAEDKYSYTLYDSLGRIVEVGQVVNSAGISPAEAADTAFIKAFINDGTRTEITHTYYDKPLPNTAGGSNLRNRIAAVAFYDQYMPNSLLYQTATHYSYDIHGNVKRLVQDIPALGTYSRKLTYIDYEYDLVSGNVNKVWFQKEKPEQFMHRYRYDADNRLTHVYTSATTNVKFMSLYHKKTYLTTERIEARYFYLPNGFLSRIELGQKNVQGTDYAYTLQGWLKDINGYKTDDENWANSDIGRDGQLNMGTINSEFCRDAFSSILQYHHNDFSPVSGTNYYNRDYAHAVPLYNGNISALTTDYLSTEINPLVKFFRYDKLNRIKGMKTNSDAGNPQCQPFYTYSTYYTYDHNGNLDTLIRYDSETNELHYIEYEYLSGNNRLDSITAWWGLNTGGYRYDAIGNLTRDNGEGLDISWNAAGKVDTIWKNGNVLSTFRYSATGQRQMKKTGNIADYYIHDASGNVMCIYRVSKRDFKAVERPIYGAKRLGELKQQVDLTTPTNPSIPPFTIGMRQYELTDHLGNVMATILDRRQPMTLANSDAYLPWIVSTTDYYPFGYPIPNRSTNTGGYRYFFNGQEADNEAFGEMALHAFEFRMHDTRLGRFWSVDPLAAKYPWNSTFAFAENSPIGYLEMEGLEKVQFGKVAVNFSNLDEKQVKFYLKKYRDYHHGNITAKEILRTDNDNEYWKVSDMSDTYMRSIGTRIVKFNMDKTTTLSDNVRMNVGQFITRYGDLEGHNDGSNSGRLTSEDWTVGLGFVGGIISGSTIIEGGFTLVNTLGLLNSIDDALGVTTKGDGSLSQNLTPDNKKDITNIIKSLVSIISTTQSTLKFTNPKANKVETVVETGVNAASLSSNARKTISQNTKD